MPVKRYRRKNASALSTALRRRFYKGAAVATLAYVVLSLISFHGQFSPLPYELAVIWAVFLLCYTTLKEMLRWNDFDDEEVYHGELWAGLVLTGAIWMIGWNIVRAWILHLPRIPFPSDYEGAAIETIVLYTLSIISSYLHRYRRSSGKFIHQKSRRSAHSQPKSTTQEKNEPITADPVQNPEIQAVLTKASAFDDKNPPADKR